MEIVKKPSRYQSDEEYCERMRKLSRERYQNNLEYHARLKKKSRERYHNDLGYQKLTLL